jgi:8-oxo-dGTP pyrophosphatase MutT (NUDIX family)
VSELRIRPAARAVLLDPDGRILLVRFEFPGVAPKRVRGFGLIRGGATPQQPGRTVWATLGGGIEPGETAEDAIRRELEEEAGLTDFELGPLVWTRLHIIPFIGGQWDGQREQYHLVRAPAFEPSPKLTSEQLEAEYVFELRWWTADELEETDATFAPRRLPELLRSLLLEGPPPEPIDAGV